MLKVFHACRQDMEIFHRLLGGRLPEPVFDTQVAAMVCGLGEEISYEGLVTRLLGERIDKTHRFVDWSRRPLAEAQLRYALADVVHLRDVYEKLRARVLALGRMEWVHEELANLLAPELYVQRPEDAWKRLKLRSREPRFVALVQELAAWREREAQEKDVPRNRILRDDLLLEIAAARPTSPEELARLERVRLDARSRREVLEIVRRVMARPESELPRLPRPERPPPGIGAVVDLLRVLLKVCCEEHEVAPRLVAGSADLEAIARDDHAPVPALRGWRRQVFGERALALKHGKIALALRGRRVEIVEVEPADIEL
ncbi:Ribonuclease D [bacterium HR39]|nr:Ribonuclease D [bacterium HR39]